LREVSRIRPVEEPRRQEVSYWGENPTQTGPHNRHGNPSQQVSIQIQIHTQGAHRQSSHSNQQLMVGAEPIRWSSTKNLTEMSGKETPPKSIIGAEDEET